jgi:hypothetical protein
MNIWRATLLVGLLAAGGCSHGTDASRDTSALGASVRDSGAGSLAFVESRPLTVTERGIGPIRVGMTAANASAAVDGALDVRKNAEKHECDYVRWRGGPKGVEVMVSRGKIARIDVDTTGIATAEGAHVGDDEEDVMALYVGRVSVTPHKYTDGHYLTITPVNPDDSLYRIVFETKGGLITRYRAGRLPQVEYVEGCS